MLSGHSALGHAGLRLTCMALERKSVSARLPVSGIQTDAGFVGDVYFKFYPGK